MRLKALALGAMAAGLMLSGFATPGYAQKTDRAITVVLPVEPDSVDSCDTQTAQNANVVRQNVYESITHVSPKDGTVEPMLSESWKRVSDLVWEFKLKEGVKFHDGTKFDAKVLMELHQRLRLAYIFISHDLALVRLVADRVGVMHGGVFVETGPTAAIFENPQHEYTRALLASSPALLEFHG